MKRLLTLFLLILMVLLVKSQNTFTGLFNSRLLEEHLVAPTAFMPIPQAKDSSWLQTLPQRMRSEYIRIGHECHGRSWDPISDAVFSEYFTNGNRTHYQQLSFGLRRQMACLVMAEIMEHQGILIKDIINGLIYFIQETWWGIPAHYPLDHPEADKQVVDLFNAETANLLAWTIYMLHDELEQSKPGICEAMRHEIDRRMLSPARTTNYSWKKKASNWNPWICSNWLSCVLFCENDRQKQVEAVTQILNSLDIFYKAYKQDGGCNEGVMYWDRAAASLYECLNLLSIATDGYISMRNDAKLKNMCSYIYNMYIGSNAYVNFADSYSYNNLHLNIVYPYACYVNDTILKHYTAYIARETQYEKRPAHFYLNSGNFPTLSRELMFLSLYSNFKAETPAEPIIHDTWQPDLQVFTARSYANSTEGLFLAAKGGHNAEEHNHNDIGNFIVYSDAHPLLIDIGVGTYTAQTFSNKRYELFNCRSAYHNVPLINGIEQHEGREYQAKRVKYNQKEKRVTFTLDISGAYPQEAHIKKWQRTIRLNRGLNVEVTEDYQLYKFLKPSEIILISCGETSVVGDGIIAINNTNGTHYIKYNHHQLSQDVEKIDIQDPLIIDAWKHKPLYRIRLIVRSQALKGTIKYTIE